MALLTKTKPFATNGRWNPSAGNVAWTERLPRHRALPAVCYAAWAAPNRRAQEDRFGKVVLKDGELAEYVLWRRSLPQDRARQWNRFLETRSPGDKLEEGLRRFRFSGEDPYDPDKSAGQQAPSLADTPRRLILGSLSQ